MSDMAAMGLGVVVGGAMSASYTRTLATAEQKAKRLGDRWTETNKRLNAAGDVVRYRGELERLRGKQAGAAVSSRRLDEGVKDLERRYREAKRELRAYGVQVGDAARAQRRMQRELRATELAQRGLNRRTRAGANLRRMRGAAVAGAGVAYGVGRMIASGMEREEQQLYLRTVINADDGDRQAAVGRAVAAARELARTSLASEAEVLEIEYALNSAGLDEQTARAGTSMVHRLAKVTRGSSEQVGEVVGTVVNNMGDQMAGSAADKMARIGDVLAQAQFRFQFRDFGQLGESFKEAAGQAVISQLSFARTAAAVGVLNNASLQGGRAGTALNAVLRNLTKASRALGTQVVRDAEGNLDLVATLDQIKTKTDSMGVQERGDLLQKIFGDEGVKGVAPMLTMLDGLREGIDALEASGGAVDAAYRPFLGSASGRWLMMTTRLRVAGDTLAQNMLPALTVAASAMADLTSWVGRAVERWPGLTQSVVWFAGGLAVAIGVAAVWNATAWLVGAAMSMWAARTKVLAAATWVWKGAQVAATAVTWAWNAALWANPLVWVGAAVVAVAGMIWYFWGPIKEFFADLWSTDTVQFFVRKVGDAVAAVKGFLRWLGLMDEEDDEAGARQPGWSVRQTAAAGAIAAGAAVGAAEPAPPPSPPNHKPWPAPPSPPNHKM